MKLPALHLSIYEIEPLTANHTWPAAMTFPIHHEDKVFQIYDNVAIDNIQLVVFPITWEMIKPYITFH